MRYTIRHFHAQLCPVAEGKETGGRDKEKRKKRVCLRPQIFRLRVTVLLVTTSLTLSLMLLYGVVQYKVSQLSLS